jgi:6-phospho-beta-glucosidase
MKVKRVAVIGAGSSYTPELIEGLISHARTFELSQLAFSDVDHERGAIIAAFAKRMFEAAKLPVEVLFTGEAREAIAGAEFVLAQVRVGKMAARVLDERIPMKYGLLGQETTGLGGMVCAFRTIPVIMEIARAIEELAPEAWLINFSNPSGLVAEAVSNATGAKIIGLCNVPLKLIKGAKELLGESGFDFDFVGLNHLCWLTGAYINGEEQLSKILDKPLELSGLANIPDMPYPMEQLRSMGAIPCGYLNYYCFHEEMVKKTIQAEKTRGEICLDLEKELFEMYKDISVCAKPAALSKRGGELYSEAAVSLMDSIANDTKDIHVVNVQNQGTLPFLDPTDVSECKCLVDSNGPHPLPQNRLPNESIIGLVQIVKAYEKLVCKAALTGSYEMALAAINTNPLTLGKANAKLAMDEMLRKSKDYLPQFAGRIPDET